MSYGPGDDDGEGVGGDDITLDDAGGAEELGGGDIEGVSGGDGEELSKVQSKPVTKPGADDGEGDNGSGAGDDDNAAAAQAAALDKKARLLGWMPKDEYLKDKRRDPRNWRPAAEFIDYSQAHNGVLRENVDKLTSKNMELEDRLREMQQTMEEFATFKQSQQQRQLDRSLDALKAKLADAIAAGDGAEATRLIDERERIIRAGNVDADGNPVVAPPKKPAANAGEKDPRFITWKGLNPWYGTDADMTRYANRMSVALRAEGDKTSGEPFLQKVLDEVKARYPAKFTTRRPPPPEGGNGGRGSGTGGAGAGAGGKPGQRWEDLPADARDAANRFIKQGLVKDRAAYLKDYFEGE